MSLGLRGGVKVDRDDTVADLLAPGGRCNHDVCITTLVANYVELTSLSDEILARIFELVGPGEVLLVTVPSVCKRFRQVCKRCVNAELNLQWLIAWPTTKEAALARSKFQTQLMAGDDMSWGVLKEAYASVRGEQGRSGSLVQLQTLFRRFYRVRSITFGAPLAETPSIRDTFQGDEWLHLEESNEDEFRLGPVTVGMEVLQALENLGIESLTMIHTKFPSRSPELDNLPADPSYLELISSYCPRLQHVELLAVDYATINDAGLAALTAMCPQLQTLRVQWATLVLPPASPDLIPLQLFAKSRGAAGLPSLRHLLLSACCEKKNAIAGNNTTMPIINDDTLLAIAQHCKRLRSLCLQEAPDDTASGAGEGQGEVNDGLKAIAAACPDLELVRLDLEKATAEDGVKGIATKCKKLTDLFSMTGVTRALIATDDCPAIEVPSVTHYKANWYEYNNNTDGMLLHCIGGAHVFPNLQVLDLPDIDDQHEIDRDLLRSNVATALAGCPELRQIVVGSPMMLMLLAPLKSILPGVVVTLRSRAHVGTIGQSIDGRHDSTDSSEVLTYKW